MKKQSCIITGAAGFIGSHLSEFLMRKGFSVIGIDNFSTGQAKNFDYLSSLNLPDTEFIPIEADTCNPWTWAAPFKDTSIKHIFYLASPASPLHYQRLWMETMCVNTIGLKNGLDFANEVNAKLLYSSTSEIYGDPEVSPQPESYKGNVNTVGPRACYDESKRMGETLLWNYNHNFKSNHKIVRIFNTFGPRMNPNDGRVIINFIKQMIEGTSITVYGDGMQTRSFCYVDDLIRGIYLLAESNESGPINLGNENEITILELIEVLKRIYPKKTLNIEHFSLPTDDPSRRRPNLELANSLLNWTPEVSLEDGLRTMVEWLENET